MLPSIDRAELGALALLHLESVVAIDSASDETSTTVPSTEGQRRLSEHLRAFFEELGATVEVDEHANVIATLAGRGDQADRSPLALMIHLDTARGTAVLESLNVQPTWDGGRIPYPDAPDLQVTVDAYPSTAQFLGQDLVFGDGRAPFGLDDKLGLTHMMTLARLLHDHPDVPHRPLLLIGRPDEEIGREEALLGLAATLADRGVDSAYTVDGIEPYEVNTANFNALGGHVSFPARALPDSPGVVIEAHIGGVNTHGATARAEGHRGAVRLAAEVCGRLPDGAVPLRFACDVERDCDGVLAIRAPGGAESAVRSALEAVVGPHVPRGASLSVARSDDRSGDGAVDELLGFVRRFLASGGPQPLLCEDSDDWQGYTQPYRARWSDGALRLDFRVRDFDPAALLQRRDHVAALAGTLPNEWSHQYKNMGPTLARRPDLRDAAMDAARAVGAEPKDRPIRGGTGVDPFLEAGVFVANVGTGYFAPESEKEFTSLQVMADHALWLLALAQG